MKYHSNLSTFFISLVVMLLFVLTSALIIFEFNLTSPTLILTDKIISEISSSDGDISFSFSSMERNLRDRVLINDISIGYRDVEVARFDSLEIKLSMFDLIGYALTGRKQADLVFKGGRVSVPEGILDGGGDGQNANHSASGQKDRDQNPIPQSLRKYRFNAVFQSFDLEFGQVGEILDLDAEFYFGGSLESIDATLYVPLLEFGYQGFNGEARFLGLTLTHEDEFVLKALVDELSLNTPYGIANARDFAFKASLASVMNANLRDLSATANFNTLDIRGEEYDASASLSGFSARYVDGDLLGNLGEVIVKQGENTLHGRDGEVLVEELSVFGGSFSELDFSGFGVNGQAEAVGAIYGLKDKNFSFRLSHLEVEDLSGFTGGVIGKGEVDGFWGRGSLDGVNAEFALEAKGEAKRLLEKDLSLSLKASVKEEDGDYSFVLDVPEAVLGFGTEKAKIHAEGSQSNFAYSFSYGDMVSTSGTFDLGLLNAEGTVDIPGLPVSEGKGILGEYYERYSAYFEDDSSLDGRVRYNLGFNADALTKVLGEVDMDIAFHGAHVNVVDSEVGVKAMLGLKEDRLSVESFTLHTDYVDLFTRGYVDYERMLPDFYLNVSLPDGGRAILDGNFNLQEGTSYIYSAVLPILNDAYFSGSLNLTSNRGATESVLKTGVVDRPFTAELDLEERFFKVDSDKLHFDFNYRDGIETYIEFNNLDTVRNGYGDPIILNGRIDLNAGRGRSYNLVSNEIRFGNFWLVPGGPDISFNVWGNEKGFWINNILVKGDSELEFSGSGIYRTENSSFTFGMRETNGEGVIALSIYRDELFAGILRIEELDMGPFGLAGLTGNMNLSGRAAQLRDFTFSGDVRVSARDTINDDRNITGRVSLDNSDLVLDDIHYLSAGMEISVDNFSFNSPTGVFSLDGVDVYMKGEHADRDYPISVSVSASGTVPEEENLYISVFNLVRTLGNGSEFTVNIDNLDIDNSKIITRGRTTSASVSDNFINMEGNLLSGYVDLLQKHATVSLDLLPVVKGSADIDFSDKLWMNVDLDGFNMYLMNLFFNAPLIVFDQDYLFGEIGLVQEDKETFVLSGNLGAEELSLEIFWAPDQRLVMQSPRFTLWENEARSSMTPTAILDYLDYSRTDIETVIAFSFTPQLGFNGYEAGLYTAPDKEIRVRIPLPENNIDIMGYVTGTYIFTSSDGMVTNDGYLNLYDTTVTIGMNPYPEWYGISGEMFIDLGLNFERNNTLAYPAGPNPMVSITIADHNDIFFHLGRDGVAASGGLNVRGGEIFYFNKYFYVLDGSVKFENAEKLDPTLSLRAALREFDAEGNKVEIYLVMKDNTFDSISPTFESNPVMELSEIMGILGQSILPESQYGEFNVSSVASLVSESYNLLARLGVVESNATASNLNSSIKQVFGLDTFSIHTNILNNLIIDTLADFTDGRTVLYSPMARYLDGTTLNVGKYLSPDLYLQAMIHLDAGRDKASYTLFSDDLMIDSEVFLEWQAEPYSITFFTTPKYFSFYSLMDTFGFTIKKTIRL